MKKMFFVIVFNNYFIDFYKNSINKNHNDIILDNNGKFKKTFTDKSILILIFPMFYLNND